METISIKKNHVFKKNLWKTYEFKKNIYFNNKIKIIKKWKFRAYIIKNEFYYKKEGLNKGVEKKTLFKEG